MNILLINHYAGSPKYGMEYRPYYLAREWRKLGHNVRIVASSESHLHQLKPQISGAATLEVIDNIEYVWLKTPAYLGNRVKRIINMFSFSKKLFSERRHILRNFTPDVVIASSPHPFIFRGAKSLANKTGAKLVFEVRDLWPLSLIELLGLSPLHPFVALLQHEENYAYKHADKVACLLPNALDYMTEHGLAPEKFMHTPNGILVDDWDDSINLSESHLKQIKEFKQRFDFLIGYAGTHGKPNALSFLIDAAQLIEDHSIGIVLIGNGPEKDALMLQAKALELNNILFLDEVNKVMIPSFLKQMNALYIGWELQPLYRFGISANKLFEYMMSGKPIIHSVKAGNDPIEQSGCGISCLPEDPQTIAQAIIKIYRQPKPTLEEMGIKGKKMVTETYSYHNLAKKYLTTLY